MRLRLPPEERLRFAPPVLRLAPPRRLLAPPPFLAPALRRLRLAAAALAAAFAAARLFLVRAAFLAAALRLAFDVAIVLCSEFLTSYVVQVSSFCVNYVTF